MLSPDTKGQSLHESAYARYQEESESRQQSRMVSARAWGAGAGQPFDGVVSASQDAEVVEMLTHAVVTVNSWTAHFKNGADSEFCIAWFLFLLVFAFYSNDTGVAGAPALANCFSSLAVWCRSSLAECDHHVTCCITYWGRFFHLTGIHPDGDFGKRIPVLTKRPQYS